MADFEQYVWAAQSLGYENADLTTHSAQIRDLYGTEDGLDLGALEADAVALSTLASIADDALRANAESLVQLSDAWAGQAAEAARDFLRRHGDAASAVSVAVRSAARAVSALRDQLWQTIDAKVDTVLAIDARTGSQRAEWLAAAHTVLTGSGDLATASEIVDQRLRPFVQTAIGSEWTSAMHASTAAVAAAYDTATATVTPDQFTSFGVPGRLGPSSATADLAAANPTAAIPSAVAPARMAGPVNDVVPAAPTLPAAAIGPPSAMPLAAPVAADPMASAPPMSPSSMPSPGDLGGMSGLGGGLAGLGRQLFDGVGDLAGDRPIEPDPLDDADTDTDTDADADENDDDADDTDDVDDHGAKDEAPPRDTDGPPVTDPLKPEPAPTLPPEPPMAQPMTRPDVIPEVPVDPAARTPCEIAASEVPQVGE